MRGRRSVRRLQLQPDRAERCQPLFQRASRRRGNQRRLERHRGKCRRRRRDRFRRDRRRCCRSGGKRRRDRRLSGWLRGDRLCGDECSGFRRRGRRHDFRRLRGRGNRCESGPLDRGRDVIRLADDPGRDPFRRRPPDAIPEALANVTRNLVGEHRDQRHDQETGKQDRRSQLHGRDTGGPRRVATRTTADNRFFRVFPRPDGG